VTGPDTTISGGPTGPTNDSTPSFTFTSSETATFQCRVDTATPAPCTSPFTSAPLAEGAHTFEVFATDVAGTPDPTPAARSFSVDVTVPDTTITSGPSGSTTDTTPTFEFSSTEAGSTFACRIDAEAFAACTSPVTTAALSPGAHTFEVAATDAAGNLDATPATRALTVEAPIQPDTTAPQTTITAGPAGPTTDATPTFDFSPGEAGSKFECRIDGAPFVACSPPFTTPALRPGPHTFEVVAIDGAGNRDPTPASRTFTVVSAGDGDRDGIPDALDTSDASVGPTIAKTAVAEVERGRVLIKRPAGAAGRSSRQAGAAGFVPLKGAEVIPLGSLLDTTKGRVTLTTAASAKTGAQRPTQSSEFYAGIFQIKQARASKPVTELTLRSTTFAKQCAGTTAKGAQAAAAGRRTKVVTQLWGNGKGRFRTRGRNSTATVRGTMWLTQERCDGTLTRVKRGSVTVRDLRAGRTVTLRAPRVYIARAQRAAAKKRTP